ncbi:MAG TPA: hypothetical protein DEB09_00110 [Candidatus Magasanikbacteria bacterium]|nr:hypothetical protein [Candidatus Magasanikbacteria bacterium]
MNNLSSIFGLLGSIAAASLFFPQVFKSYKTKQTKELAWFTIIIGMFNGICWIAYGLLKLDPFIYVTNTVLFIGALLLMFLKTKYK